MALPSFSFEIYQLFFVAINILLIFVMAKLSKKPGLLALFILGAGSILLFRFDLLVMALLVSSLISFQKSRLGLSGFFLGVATATKLFPVILLPYFLWCLFKKKDKIGEFWKLLGSFISTLIVVFWLFSAVAGQSFGEVLTNLTTVLKVSVHMESVMGTILTLITAVTNPGPHGVDFVNAIWALDPLYYLGHDRIFGYLGTLGIGLTYLIILWKVRDFKITTCLILILVLILTSRIFSPQYVIWVALLSLLTDLKLLDKTLIFLTLVCTQIIYPLNYGELIDFFNEGKNVWLFGILATRNLLLVILFVRLLINEKLVPFLSKK
jgi:uncharacterized membrane protein